VVQAAKCLLSKYKALSLNLITAKKEDCPFRKSCGKKFLEVMHMSMSQIAVMVLLVYTHL
jgi:hypothetical protein